MMLIDKIYFVNSEHKEKYKNYMNEWEHWGEIEKNVLFYLQSMPIMEGVELFEVLDENEFVFKFSSLKMVMSASQKCIAILAWNLWSGSSEPPRNVEEIVSFVCACSITNILRPLDEENKRAVIQAIQIHERL